MDFIDWCHHILGILEKEKLKGYIHYCDMPEIIFSKDLTEQEDFHYSNALSRLDQTLNMLADAALVDSKDQSYWKISTLGRKVFADPINFWSEICNEILDVEEETLLKIVNKHSPQLNETPKYGWLKEVGRKEVCSAFEIKLPPFETDEQMANFQKIVYDLPRLLGQREFLKAYPGLDYSTTI